MDARTFRYSKNRYLSIHILLTCCYTCTALRITLKVYLCIQIPSLLHLLYCNTNANKSVFMYSIPPKISQVKLKKKRISTKLRLKVELCRLYFFNHSKRSIALFSDCSQIRNTFNLYIYQELTNDLG